MVPTFVGNVRCRVAVLRTAVFADAAPVFLFDAGHDWLRVDDRFQTFEVQVVIQVVVLLEIRILCSRN